MGRAVGRLAVVAALHDVDLAGTGGRVQVNVVEDADQRPLAAHRAVTDGLKDVLNGLRRWVLCVGKLPAGRRDRTDAGRVLRELSGVAAHGQRDAEALQYYALARGIRPHHGELG